MPQLNESLLSQWLGEDIRQLILRPNEWENNIFLREKIGFLTHCNFIIIIYKDKTFTNESKKLSKANLKPKSKRQNYAKI
jgi:hypothetical protein